MSTPSSETSSGAAPAIDLTILISPPAAAITGDGLSDAVRTVLAGLGVTYEVIALHDTAFGEALRAGFGRARGRWIAMVDDGLNNDPDVLGRLWEARDACGLVIASRYIAGGHAAMAFRRRWTSWIANRVARRVLSLDMQDISSACRLYRRDAVRDLTLESAGFDVLQEVLILVQADGWSIREVPYRYRGSVKRHSLRHWHQARGFARTLLRLWQLRNSAFSADYDERAYNSVIPLQRYWQRTRYARIREFVEPNRRTLDIGCGSSRIIQSLPGAVGLDIQLKKLRHISRASMRLVQGSLTRLPFIDGAFETVVCSQVIEHVPYDLVDWTEMSRVLVRGGTLVIGTPDYATFTWRALEWAYGIVHPKGYVREHINQYTARSLAEELERHGFEITGTAYVGGGELIYRARKK